MNRLSLTRRTQIIGCLVEGNSIRSTERITDTHRDTVMRLLVEVGTGCAKILDDEMRGLTCKRIQMDEIWAYVGKKQKQLTPDDDRSQVGDQWTFVAIDPDTKLIPVHRVGKRDLPTATAFLTDLSERLTNPHPTFVRRPGGIRRGHRTGVRRRCRLRAGGKNIRRRIR